MYVCCLKNGMFLSVLLLAVVQQIVQTTSETVHILDDISCSWLGSIDSTDGLIVVGHASSCDGQTCGDGCVYIYSAIEHGTFSSETIEVTKFWTQTIPLSSQLFGSFVAIDGDNVAVTTRDAAIGVFMYTRTGPLARDWENQETRLLPTCSSSGQGLIVALNGLLVVAGAWQEASATGQAHLWAESSVGAQDWVSNGELIITANDANTGHDFGFALGFRNNGGDTDLFIGAYGNDMGYAYVFTESSPGLADFTQFSQFTENSLVSNDRYANQLEVDGRYLVVWGEHTGSGKLFCYMESALGAKDWESSPPTVIQTSSIPAEASATNGGYPFGDGGFAIHGTDLWIGNTGSVMSAVRCSASADGMNDFSCDMWVVSKNSVAQQTSGEIAFAGDNVALYFPTSTAGFKKVIILNMCPEGYGGDYPDCYQDNDCRVSSCALNGGLCTNDTGVLASIPEFGNVYGLPGCDCTSVNALGDVCEAGSCNNGTLVNSQECDCTGSGNLGVFCDEPCLNGGVDDAENGFTQCNCTGTGHIGVYCEDQCLNGGVADASFLFEQCRCPNFIGTTCQKGYCNAGMADPTFSTCNCTGSGATGKFCNKDVDDCLSSPCANGGTCSDFGTDLFPNHANEFNCSCTNSYMGPLCTDTLCVSSPCQNGGSCVNGVDVACNCKLTGYEGEWCQSEVDECTSSPCLNAGECFDLLANFSCACDGTGFEGRTCAEDVDDCLSSPCLNGGACSDKGVKNYKCTCEDGYEGPMCETMSQSITACLSSPCENGGLCMSEDAEAYTCNCSATEFQGLLCDQPIDKCLSFPCQNNGTCVTLAESTFECNCATGFMGADCSELIDVPPLDDPCMSMPCLDGELCVANTDASGYSCNRTEDTVVDANEIYILLQFSAFENENDTIEDFAEALPGLLVDALGGNVSDYTDVEILQYYTSSSDEDYVVSVLYANPENLTPEFVEEQISQPVSPIAQRVKDIQVTSEKTAPSTSDDDDEVDKDNDDDTGVIVGIIIAVIAGLLLTVAISVKLLGGKARLFDILKAQPKKSQPYNLPV